MFYSASTNGFYSTEINGDNIPSDAVEIQYSLYKQLLQAQSEGRQILSDADGYPYSAAVYMPNLREVKDGRIKYINAEADKAFAQILAPYPSHEVATWPSQYTEAAALQSDPDAYTPTLAGIALVSGETVAALATAVLAKAAAYTAVSGQIVGKRKLKTAQIEAIQVISGDEDAARSQVGAITWQS
jgi:hypothetical protein